MSKQTDKAEQPPIRPPSVRQTVSRPHLADHTTAEILAQAPAGKPRRTRRKESAKNLGVFDAERDILDQYLVRGQQDPAAQSRSRRWRSPAGSSAGDPEAMQELIKREPSLRHLGGQEVPEPGLGPQRPDRRREPGAAHRGPEVRSRPGRQVHLLRRLVDPAGDPRRAGPAGPHGPGATQPHRRPLPDRPQRRDPAPGAGARAHARKRSPKPPACRGRGPVARRPQLRRRPARCPARWRGRPLPDRPLRRPTSRATRKPR